MRGALGRLSPKPIQREHYTHNVINTIAINHTIKRIVAYNVVVIQNFPPFNFPPFLTNSYAFLSSKRPIISKAKFQFNSIQIDFHSQSIQKQQLY